MKTVVALTFIASVAIAGCALTPPPELVHARLTYQRASAGPATTLAPMELSKAKEALARAEGSFSKEGDAYRTRDLAYVATRKTEMANAVAQIASEKVSKEKADQDLAAAQTVIVAKTKHDLAVTRENLAASELGGAQTRKDLVASEKSGEKTADALAAERTARMAAETTATQALAALAKLAEVKQEERGIVITLSGSVLFASGKAALLPIAQERLNQVAEALLTTRERNLVVEGHTDSRGKASYNLDLSQRRAEAVRSYLMSRGYGAERITALGIGEGRPVSNNATAEGRANNRRVEIIVQRVVAAMR